MGTFHGFRGMRPQLQYKLGLTFFISFIIPIVVFGIFLLVSFNRILANNLYTYQEASVNQLKDELDKYLIDLHRISRSLSYDIPFTIELANREAALADEDEALRHQESITASIDALTESEPSILAYLLLTDQGRYYRSAGIAEIDRQSTIIPDPVRELLEVEEQAVALLKARHEYLKERSMQSLLLFAANIKITYLDQKRMGNGILVLFIDRNYIDAIVQRHSRSSDQIYLFSNSGSHIYSSDREVSYKSLPAELQSSLNNQRSGRYRIRDGNQNYLISFITSRFSSLKLLGFTSDRRIRNDIFFLSKFTIIFLLVLLLLFLFFTVQLAHSISLPVNRLERIMTKLEESNYRDTSDLLARRNRGILSPYFDHLFRFLHSVIMKINEYHRKEKEQELMILQSQINPHFVYNSLNTIRIMADMEGRENLARAIRSLIHLLKNSIKIGVIFISIREEINQIRDYIYLQQLRYANAFTVDIQVDEEVYTCKCIKFILQPIVENAIFHGIDTGRKEGRISIEVRKRGAEIEYRIEDNGKGMDAAQLKEIEAPDLNRRDSDRIGLHNVSSRLKTYFGEQYGLSIESSPGKGTRVSYTIPAERHEQ